MKENYDTYKRKKRKARNDILKSIFFGGLYISLLAGTMKECSEVRGNDFDQDYKNTYILQYNYQDLYKNYNRNSQNNIYKQEVK